MNKPPFFNVISCIIVNIVRVIASGAKQSFCVLILLAFLVNTIGLLPQAQAEELYLPKPGVRVNLSPTYNPPVLKGITVHPDNPFKFDFILDKGDRDSVIASVAKQSHQEQLKQESKKLVKYFLSAITTPEKDLWVNLSPYEKDRIIPESFGQTDMGRDLLAQDYLLKQITATLMYPEGEVGKIFWKNVYDKAAKNFGTTNIPVNTFNKVWIVPDHAKVYEHGNTAFVVNSRLKVMLDQDYVSLRAQRSNLSLPANGLNTLSSQILREIIIPELEKEVNEGKNFAPLRQVYQSLILAVWFKKRMKDSLLGRKYMDQSKTNGIHYENTVIASAAKQSFNDTELIYQRYLQAFKKGVYSYIKEEQDPATQQMIPRKYFSGGARMDRAMQTTAITTDKAQLSSIWKVIKRCIGISVSVANSSTEPLNKESLHNLAAAFSELHYINDMHFTERKELVPGRFIRVTEEISGLRKDNEIVAAVGCLSCSSVIILDKEKPRISHFLYIDPLKPEYTSNIVRVFLGQIRTIPQGSTIILPYDESYEGPYKYLGEYLTNTYGAKVVYVPSSKGFIKNAFIAKEGFAVFAGEESNKMPSALRKVMTWQELRQQPAGILLMDPAMNAQLITLSHLPAGHIPLLASRLNKLDLSPINIDEVMGVFMDRSFHRQSRQANFPINHHSSHDDYTATFDDLLNEGKGELKLGNVGYDYHNSSNSDKYDPWFGSDSNGRVKVEGNLGWKFHLNVLPEHVRSVAEYLIKNDYEHKYFMGGSLTDGKVFTIYIGSYALAKKLALQLSQDLHQWLAMPKDINEIEFAPGVIGRFVVGESGVLNAEDKENQYGKYGVSYLRKSFSLTEYFNPSQDQDGLRRSVTEFSRRYGNYFYEREWTKTASVYHPIDNNRLAELNVLDSKPKQIYNNQSTYGNQSNLADISNYINTMYKGVIGSDWWTVGDFRSKARYQYQLNALVTVESLKALMKVFSIPTQQETSGLFSMYDVNGSPVMVRIGNPANAEFSANYHQGSILLDSIEPLSEGILDKLNAFLTQYRRSNAYEYGDAVNLKGQPLLGIRVVQIVSSFSAASRLFYTLSEINERLARIVLDFMKVDNAHQQLPYWRYRILQDYFRSIGYDLTYNQDLDDYILNSKNEGMPDLDAVVDHVLESVNRHPRDNAMNTPLITLSHLPAGHIPLLRSRLSKLDLSPIDIDPVIDILINRSFYPQSRQANLPINHHSSEADYTATLDDLINKGKGKLKILNRVGVGYDYHSSSDSDKYDPWFGSEVNGDVKRAVNLGWKFHLNVLPEHVKNVAEYLIAHDYEHKYFNGGSLTHGKVFTVYIGSYALAKKLALELSRDLHQWLAMPKSSIGEIEFAPGVVGRFVVAQTGVLNMSEAVNQYGKYGISYVSKSSSLSRYFSPLQERNELRLSVTELARRYGNYFYEAGWTKTPAIYHPIDDSRLSEFNVLNSTSKQIYNNDASYGYQANFTDIANYINTSGGTTGPSWWTIGGFRSKARYQYQLNALVTEESLKALINVFNMSSMNSVSGSSIIIKVGNPTSTEFAANYHHESILLDSMKPLSEDILNKLNMFMVLYRRSNAYEYGDVVNLKGQALLGVRVVPIISSLSAVGRLFYTLSEINEKLAGIVLDFMKVDNAHQQLPYWRYCILQECFKSIGYDFAYNQELDEYVLDSKNEGVSDLDAVVDRVLLREGDSTALSADDLAMKVNIQGDGLDITTHIKELSINNPKIIRSITVIDKDKQSHEVQVEYSLGNPSNSINLLLKYKDQLIFDVIYTISSGVITEANIQDAQLKEIGLSEKGFYKLLLDKILVNVPYVQSHINNLETRNVIDTFGGYREVAHSILHYTLLGRTRPSGYIFITGGDFLHSFHYSLFGVYAQSIERLFAEAVKVEAGWNLSPDLLRITNAYREIARQEYPNKTAINMLKKQFEQLLGQMNLDSNNLYNPIAMKRTVERQIRRLNELIDIAPEEVGGIDLTDDRMKIDMESDKAAVSQPMDLKALENINIDGLYIKDIEIKPLTNLPQLLGIS